MTDILLTIAAGMLVVMCAVGLTILGVIACLMIMDLRKEKQKGVKQRR